MSMTRRDFLKAAGIMSLAAAVPVATGEPSGYSIGCYTRCFDQFEFEAALDGIAEAGYKYAGIMTGQGKKWVAVSPETPVEELAKVGEQVKRRGMSTISVYGDHGKYAAKSVEEGVKALHRLIEHCKACGSPQLLIGGTTHPEVVENYYKAVSECCPFAAENGITISIKPHGGQNSTGPQCRKIVESVKAPNFRLWYDPGNIFYYSDGKLDPVQDSEQVDGLVCGVSIKDFLPPKEVMVTPGDGLVKFDKVLANLRKGGFRSGPMVVECIKRGTFEEAKAEAKKARLFLENLNQKLAFNARPAGPWSLLKA